MSLAPVMAAAGRASGVRGPRQVRGDIQGLRALAVGVVVTYHLAPSLLPGGFVGVDVFFVISGFLITLHLCQHVPRDAADLAGFWARRLRRLLPASLLVLLATLALSRLIGPDTQWGGTAADVRAATLYWFNWALAGQAVDYLGAAEAPSPVQHFWSLAVEEQFYLVWPVLVLLVARAARRRRWPVHVALFVGAVATVALSLAWSVLYTRSNPSAAYFVTPTRMWELAAGGVLAVVSHGRAQRRAPEPATPVRRAVLAVLGLLAIAYSCLTYSAATPFPGWAAALPVLGAVLVLAAHAGPDGPGWSPGVVMSRWSVQWVGDSSYSIYLWHWPLIVLVGPHLGATGGHHPGLLGAVVVLAVTLVLAWATKRWVEDPLRRPRTSRPVAAAFGAAAIAMAVVLALSGLQSHEVQQDQRAAEQQLAAAVRAGGPCFGAASLSPGATCAQVPSDQAVPPPAQAAADRADAYDVQADGRDCWANPPRFGVRRCVFGDGDRTVVLLGNSHAGQWLPALQRLAADHHLRIVTYLASQCAAAELPQDFAQAGATEACAGWLRRVTAAVARERPDAIVYTNRVSVTAVGSSLARSYPRYTEGVRRELQRLRTAGIPVLVLRDTPAPGDSVPDCLAGTGSGDSHRCDGTRAEWLPPEPARAAVASLADTGIVYTDLTDRICRAARCQAITGGVVTYYDGSHLTATYATTLAPYLWPSLSRTLRQGRR